MVAIGALTIDGIAVGSNKCLILDTIETCLDVEEFFPYKGCLVGIDAGLRNI